MTTSPLLSLPVQAADGAQTTLGDLLDGRAALVVNVASKCGLTPQYTALQSLHAEYDAAGFTVLAFPCNQFGGQEPGTAEEIQSACSTNYGVTFPVLAKVDVNGPRPAPVWRQLTEVPDSEGRAGEVDWNFEKFVVSATGDVVARFRPLTDPLSDEVRAAVEQVTGR